MGFLAYNMVMFEIGIEVILSGAYVGSNSNQKLYIYTISEDDDDDDNDDDGDAESL